MSRYVNDVDSVDVQNEISNDSAECVDMNKTVRFPVSAHVQLASVVEELNSDENVDYSNAVACLRSLLESLFCHLIVMNR